MVFDTHEIFYMVVVEIQTMMLAVTVAKTNLFQTTAFSQKFLGFFLLLRCISRVHVLFQILDVLIQLYIGSYFSQYTWWLK